VFIIIIIIIIIAHTITMCAKASISLGKTLLLQNKFYANL